MLTQVCLVSRFSYFDCSMDQLYTVRKLLYGNATFLVVPLGKYAFSITQEIRY